MGWAERLSEWAGGCRGEGWREAAGIHMLESHISSCHPCTHALIPVPPSSSSRSSLSVAAGLRADWRARQAAVFYFPVWPVVAMASQSGHARGGIGRVGMESTTRPRCIDTAMLTSPLDSGLDHCSPCRCQPIRTNERTKRVPPTRTDSSRQKRTRAARLKPYLS